MICGFCLIFVVLVVLNVRLIQFPLDSVSDFVTCHRCEVLLTNFLFNFIFSAFNFSCYRGSDLRPSIDANFSPKLSI
jgi:ABC-type uncharacterized transport system permease subunit